MPIRTFIFITLLFFPVIGCAPKSLEPVVLREGVRFSYYAPSATNISIVGSFNRWSPGHDRLTGPDKRGIWSIILPLPPGHYEYRFVVNNTGWVLDPSAPFVDDGLGDRNSLFVVEP